MRKLFSFLFFILLILPAATLAQDTLIENPAAQHTDTVAVVSIERNFAPNYKEKYNTEAFNYERKKANKKLSKWEEFLNWLDNALSSGDRREGESLSIGAIITRVVAVIVILLVIYFIVRALLKKEGYWIFGKSRKSIAAKDIGIENIDTVDFQSLIKDTQLTEDYRLGIRYYYLWLLKLLAYNNIIKWHQDKTNSDYLYEIKDESLRTQFRYLSYIYDYSWYGEFPVSHGDYTKAEKAFLETINKLKR